ncbi:ArsB/NhaD family transporter, partial [Salmonella enterica]|uniref:ArsB/NhaD family transporter n=1 Tax=Salmonella enterica TaxID=28901 RepID=UPI003D2F7936
MAAPFANDGGGLILSPIGIAPLLALGVSKRNPLAFLLAAGFFSDTGRLAPTRSHPVYILSAATSWLRVSRTVVGGGGG